MVPGLEVVFYYSWFVIFWFLDMSHMHGRVSKARTMRGVGPWSGGGVLIFMVCGLLVSRYVSYAWEGE